MPAKKGLYANIQSKRKRIAKGGGEKMREETAAENEGREQLWQQDCKADDEEEVRPKEEVGGEVGPLPVHTALSPF